MVAQSFVLHEYNVYYCQFQLFESSIVWFEAQNVFDSFFMVVNHFDGLSEQMNSMFAFHRLFDPKTSSLFRLLGHSINLLFKSPLLKLFGWGTLRMAGNILIILIAISIVWVKRIQFCRHPVKF